MNRVTRFGTVVAVAALIASAALAETATGIVFDDRNDNGVRDANEPGIPGVAVSNGTDVVKTDAGGRYSLTVTDHTVLFVIKPSGWKPPVTSDNLPRFFYIHKPNGSPATRFPATNPTGPLPPSVDFPLRKVKEPSRFQAVFFGDPQARDLTEVDYVTRDVVEELIGVDAAFGLTLGDIAFDNLNIHRPLNAAVGRIGIPWYNVAGNHDENYDAADDRHALESFTSVYGPRYYAFNVGKVHFIGLDDVMWNPEKKNYSAGLGADQMEFLKNDLALVPKDRLVVLTMHIPINQIAEKEALFELLKDRPHTLSISGHTHYQANRFLTASDGWKGRTPHHHLINGAVCGVWWSGATDELGIPHTTMADGAPNGYSVITFDGVRYTVEFKAARRPWSYQMNVWAPQTVEQAELAGAAVVANVFNGSERSVVEMRVDAGRWIPMKQTPGEDPFYVELKKLEAGETRPNGRTLPGVDKTPHLWTANLPAGLSPGAHTITVRETDMFGRVHTGRRVVTVR
jgi:hypothetical protein